MLPSNHAQKFELLPLLVMCLSVGSLSLTGCPAQLNFDGSSSSVESKTANHLADTATDGVEKELVAGPWWGWRGPNRNGVVIDQTPVTKWSETENVIWKSPIPGRGHASPIVVGDQVILATSDVDQKTQSVISFDKKTGQQNWATVVNQGNFNRRIYPTNTHASSSVTTDGETLFAVFNNNSAAQLAALDLSGKILWEKQAAKFIPKRYQFGFGSSPILYKDTVIVASECEQDGSIVALNKKTGDEVWRIARATDTSYSTPVIAYVAGKEQMIISGANATTSYNPASGEENWRVPGPWSVTCGTAVWSDDMVFVSGGYPTSRTMGIKADGSGEVVWENKAKCYEQSMLFFDGYIYALADNGAAYCWRAKDGEEMWVQRLDSGVSASPVLAGGNIYISVEDGTTFVFKPNPAELELVAENQLGNAAYATPTFVDNQIFLRVADGSGKNKQEWLYCVGKP